MITDELAKYVIAQLLYLEMQDKKSPIHLRINSPGGSVTASLAILDTIAYLKPPTHTHCDSMACGMALWILATGAPGHRTANPNSHLSIETTRIDEQRAAPEQTLQFMEQLHQNLTEILTKHTKIERHLASLFLQEGRALSGAEALQFGIIDAQRTL